MAAVRPATSTRRSALKWPFPRIVLDSYPGALEQVLTNLIDNAVNHGAEGSPILHRRHHGRSRRQRCPHRRRRRRRRHRRRASGTDLRPVLHHPTRHRRLRARPEHCSCAQSRVTGRPRRPYPAESTVGEERASSWSFRSRRARTAQRLGSPAAIGQNTKTLPPTGKLRRNIGCPQRTLTK